MISGGLDSLLAATVLRKQDIDIVGVHFLNGFSPGVFRRRVTEGLTMEEIAAEKKEKLSRILGARVEVIDRSAGFLEILSAPRHGFGKNMNPCIDCRIFFLRNAREIMEEEEADFIFTGEVLGQRPMSQHMKAMRTVERESGLEGILLRPLCAKLLAPTKPETEGLVDRERLFDIQGRSRKRQIELAAELGLTGYQTPAGGCALTDENYSRKLRDLIDHKGGRKLSTEDAVLLSTGRHLRINEDVKLVVGRNEKENDYLERSWRGSWMATTPDHPGPVVLIDGDPGEGDLAAAASVTARYSDGKRETSVRVLVSRGDEVREYNEAPADDSDLERWRI